MSHIFTARRASEQQRDSFDSSSANNIRLKPKHQALTSHNTMLQENLWYKRSMAKYKSGHKLTHLFLNKQ